MRRTAKDSRKHEERVLPLPVVCPPIQPLDGRALLNWLKRQGAKPIPPKERIRLRSLGFLGMPDE
jgi:hypothetical protein